MTPTAWDPDRHLRAIGSGNTVEIWDMRATDEPARRLECGECATTLRFTLDGTKLVAAYMHGAVGVWEVGSPQAFDVRQHHTPDSMINSLAISSNGAFAVTASSASRNPIDNSSVFIFICSENEMTRFR
ncbi:hypothetical protein [Sphingobium sp. MK2]|uniref:WD40 repeat domain-containing protein n=1 Tax=Sphingobium sp. MK2 TaxID=3116540 RepID=UPI0032E365E2